MNVQWGYLRVYVQIALILVEDHVSNPDDMF